MHVFTYMWNIKKNENLMTIIKRKKVYVYRENKLLVISGEVGEGNIRVGVKSYKLLHKK